MLEVTGE